MNKYCISCFALLDEDADVCPYCGCKQEKEAKEKYQLAPMTMVLGRYLIGKVAGTGGFGITYKAYDFQLQQIVAIKEYFPSRMVQRTPGSREVIIFEQKKDEFEKEKQRFLLEARTMAKFSGNENIVNVYNYFEENNTAYIVMEFLEGITLGDYIKQCGGSLDLDTSLEIIKNVLNALKSVHKLKVIHRDINPKNIMITINNKIVLYDFGAARLSSGEEDKTLTIVLTQGYAPPEQYRNKSKQGPFTDIYAVGAMFYYMITGIVPIESIDRVNSDDLKRPSKLIENLPKYVDHAILKAMALKSELRFKNADQFLEALYLKKEVLTPEAELKKRKKRRSISVSIISLLLTCVIAYTGIMSWGTSNLNITHIEPIKILMVRPDSADESTDAQVCEALLENFRQYMEDNKFKNYDKFDTETINIEFATPSEYMDALNSEKYDVFVTDYASSDDELEISNDISFINKKVQEDLIIAPQTSSCISLQFDFDVMYINMDLFDGSEVDAVKYIRNSLKTDPNFNSCIIDPQANVSFVGNEDSWNKEQIQQLNSRTTRDSISLDTASCTNLFTQGNILAYIGKYSERDMDRMHIKNLLIVPLTLSDENFETVEDMSADLELQEKQNYAVAADLSKDKNYEAMYFISCLANANTQQLLSAYGYSEYMPLNSEVLDLSVDQPFLREALGLNNDNE